MREVYTGLARNCEGGAEMNYNPIYLCYCKANNLNPDGKRQNSRFVWWGAGTKAGICKASQHIRLRLDEPTG